MCFEGSQECLPAWLTLQRLVAHLYSLTTLTENPHAYPAAFLRLQELLINKLCAVTALTQAVNTRKGARPLSHGDAPRAWGLEVQTWSGSVKGEFRSGRVMIPVGRGTLIPWPPCEATQPIELNV